jgi:endoglucanase
MKSTHILISLFALIQIGFSQQENKQDWWKAPQFFKPYESPTSKKLPLISVSGNKFVNANDDTILFRGLAISDPDKLADQGYWTKKHFEKVREMGAMLVRIPIHPAAWRERTAREYLKLLEQAVEWCSELEMYIIIDWHSIGNLGMEIFQNPMYNTTKTETYNFWKTIAWHFRSHNTIAFYELFNEPTLFKGLFGNMSWAEWKDINEKMIRLIQAYDSEVIPLVAGFDWAYDLTPLHFEPIEATGIGYVSHPYPMKRQPPWPEKWEENFGFAANQYPLIATEIGFGLREGDVIDDNHYGPNIINYLESKGISWIAWVFDADWHPHMFESWDKYKLTPPGEFFKKALHGEVQK